MPNITELNLPISQVGVTTTDRGTDAAAAVGRRAGALYNEAGNAIGSAIKEVGTDLGDYDAHQQISHGAVGYASLLAGATQKWNDVAKNADPNDPTIAAKFRAETLEPALQSFTDSFTNEKAREWAEQRTTSLRDHFVQKTQADMSTLAGQAAVNNMTQLSNTLQTTVRADPTSLQASLDLANSSIENIIKQNPNITGAEAGVLREKMQQQLGEQLVKAHFVGKAEMNPKAALAEFNALGPDSPYAKYIKSDEISSLIRYANMQQRQERLFASYQRQADKAMDKEAVNNESDRILRQLYSPDPAERAKVTTQTIAANDILAKDVVAKRTMLNLVERELKPETAARVSAANSNDLYRRIHLPDGDPMKITDNKELDDARIHGDISRTDHDYLRKELADIQTPDGAKLGDTKSRFLKSIAPSLEKKSVFGIADPQGAQQNYAFQQMVNNKIDEYRKNGKNPYDLFDPGKPDYLGKPDIVNGFKRPLDEIIRDSTRQLRTPAPMETPSAPKDQGRVTQGAPVPAGPVIGGPSLQAPDGKWYYRDKDGLHLGKRGE